MPSTADQDQSRHSVRTVLAHRSANALARGERIGVQITVTPSVLDTSSKGPENLASRSRIKDRTGAGRSSNEYARLRACWENHAESGCAVAAATCTRLVLSSMKNRT
jgi:hypothetical protein